MDYDSCRSLPAMFFAQAERLGDKPFLWAKRGGRYQSISWAEAARDVRRLALGLRSLGIGRGERVGLVSENRPEWIIADLAIITAGAITVPAYVTHTVEDHRHVFANSGARAVFVSKPGNADKNWIICDNTSTSPYFGNCYVGWDNSEIQMSTSSDGGLTWSTPIPTQGFDQGIGINPVVQPNGNVVVGLYDYNVGGMAAFMSTNGGKSWTTAVYIYDAPSHGEAGGLRSAGLPSTAIDGAGNVFVSWPDCSFESGCSANDIVYSSSSDGIHWSSIVRVPIDPINSGVDHFIHGLGIDPKTSGSTAHMAITYYYYPVSNCGNSCTLYAGYTQSSDGGATWTAGRQISNGMQLSWLPNTFSGRMVADYVATVFPAGGRAFPIYVIAKQPISGVYQQAVYTEGYGFIFGGGSEPTFSSANDVPIPGIKSDHRPRSPEDRDNELPSQVGHPPQHE